MIGRTAFVATVGASILGVARCTAAFGATVDYPPAPGPWSAYYQSLPPTEYGARYGIECIETLGGDLRGKGANLILDCEDVPVPTKPRPRPCPVMPCSYSEAGVMLIGVQRQSVAVGAAAVAWASAYTAASSNAQASASASVAVLIAWDGTDGGEAPEPPAAPPAPIPLPATLPLLAGALGAVTAISRRKA